MYPDVLAFVICFGKSLNFKTVTFLNVHGTIQLSNFHKLWDLVQTQLTDNAVIFETISGVDVVQLCKGSYRMPVLFGIPWLCQWRELCGPTSLVTKDFSYCIHSSQLTFQEVLRTCYILDTDITGCFVSFTFPSLLHSQGEKKIRERASLIFLQERKMKSACVRPGIALQCFLTTVTKLPYCMMLKESCALSKYP